MAFIYEKVQIGQNEGLEIRGYEGTAKKLTVPESIDGVPVISIGKNAFTDKNKELREVTLPKTVTAIKAFSFYFCSEIHKIIMTDSVDDYYDGAIRTSSGIEDLTIEMENGRYELIRRILEDSDRKLRILFVFPDYKLQLIFPDYNSNSIADPRAQTFHIRIEGSGFSYRECIRNDGIRIKEYDGLYQRALSGDDPEVAMEIAVGRLLYPHGLSEEAERVYREHIREEMDLALELAMKPENADWMELFMDAELLDEEKIDLALKLVSEKKMTAVTGMLMEYRRKHFTKESNTKLSLGGLDDFDF